MLLLVVLRAFFFESIWHSSAWQVKWTTSTCVTVWIHSRCPQGGQRQHPRSQFLNACVFRQHGRSIATTWILDVVTKKKGSEASKGQNEKERHRKGLSDCRCFLAYGYIAVAMDSFYFMANSAAELGRHDSSRCVVGIAMSNRLLARSVLGFLLFG